MGLAQVCPIEVSKHEFSSIEVYFAQVGSPQVGPPQVGPNEFAPDEKCQAEVCLAQVGSIQVSPVEDCATEVDLTQVGLTQVYPGETSSAEVRPAKVCVDKVCLDEAYAAEVWYYIWMRFSPLIPDRDTLFENKVLLLVCHTVCFPPSWFTTSFPPKLLSLQFTTQSIVEITFPFVNALPKGQQLRGSLLVRSYDAIPY